MYNSYRAVENAIHTKDSHYIDEINKWKVVFESLDGFIKVRKLKHSESVSAEATIMDFLSRFSESESVEILYNVLNRIKVNE
jgi:oligoribonuclease (3'-5' exoribonuclease)